jgi:mono/diheme cytochrome c family protein
MNADEEHLPKDSIIAPPDIEEAPREELIIPATPHEDLDEDDDSFNEFRTPGETLDLLDLHPARGAGRSMPGAGALSSAVGPGFRPIPWWVIAGSALLLAWAGLYLGTYSGGFQGDVFNEEANYKPAGPSGPVDPKAASIALGKKIFTVNCVQCHQSSGLGQPGQYPPLVGSEWVLGPAPRRLTQIVLHGIQGTIHVEGKEFNNAMPTWAALSDKELAGVLSYVRGELGGNSAPPITEQEMTDARKLTASRADPWSEAELLQIPTGPLPGDAAAPAPAAAPGSAPAAGPPQVPAGSNPPSVGPQTKPPAAPLGEGPYTPPPAASAAAPSA